MFPKITFYDCRDYCVSDIYSEIPGSELQDSSFSWTTDWMISYLNPQLRAARDDGNAVTR